MFVYLILSWPLQFLYLHISRCCCRQFNNDLSWDTGSSGDAHLTRRALRRSFQASDIVSQATPPPQSAEKSGGLSVFTKLLLLAVLAFVAFVVYQSMEPAAQNPLDGITAD